jgi:hypothetical protein
MIAKFGKQVTWRKIAANVSIQQPWKATNADPVDASVYMVFARRDSGTSFTAAIARLMNATDVPTGAPTGLMAAVSFTPEIGDLVINGNDEMRVAAIGPVAPDGTPIFYKIRFE